MRAAKAPSGAAGPWGRSARWLSCLAVLSPVAGFASTPAAAVNIAARPLADSLIAFAVQSKISIGLGRIGACGGQAAPRLVGRFTPERGLNRLLAGSGCGFRRIDAQAFDIVPLPPPARPTPPPQPAGSSVNADLSELVVVATRQATPADRLAYAVSSVSGRTLRADGVRDVGDLALVSPAMTVTNLGMGRDKVLLRGLSDGPLTGLTQSLVGAYLDDARLTFNAPDPDLRLVDMERVEVLRGPQGALYGAGSLGGVLHLVSTPPDRSRVSGRLAASVGFTAGGAPSESADGVFNLPLLSGRGAVRLVAYHETDGGYIRDNRLNINHANVSRRDGGRLSAVLDLGRNWTLSAGGVLQDIRNADTQYAVMGAGPYARNNLLQEPHDNDFNEYHIGLNGDLGWAAARASVAYIGHDIYSRYDASQAPPVRIPAGPAAFDEQDHIESVVTEETLASDPGARVQWLSGLFYAHTRQASHLTLTAESPKPTVRYAEVRHDELDEGALYGQLSVPIYAGLSVAAGGRLFLSRDQVTSMNTDVIGRPSPPYAGHVSQTGFAPKLVISERVGPGVLLYVQADEGYRGPGVNTAAAPTERLGPPGGAEPLRLFKGDELWSLEAGAKVTALDGRLRLSLAGFEAHWKGIQSDQLLPSGLPYTANVGDGRNLGLEMEAAFRTGALELRAEMLLNEPELGRANAAYPVLAETGLGVIPDKSFGLCAHYVRPHGGRRSVQLDGHWSYVGVSHLMLNVAALPHMGDYSTGRLAASLVDDHWRWTLSVDNPAGEQGNTFAYGNPFTIRFTQQATPLRPRTVTLSVEASF